MEKKSTTFTVDSEEDLFEKYKIIYNKLRDDEYSIPMTEAPGLLRKLTLIEAKAKCFGVISPNEEVEGK